MKARRAAPVVPQETESGNVDPVLVKKAVDALVKWSGGQVQKAQLLEDDQLVYVVVGMKKAPGSRRTNPYSVLLPHPLYDGNQEEICLIVSDKAVGKGKESKQEAKERIEKEEGLSIGKILTLSNLKKEHYSFEAKRKLCASYDLFLADDRILGELPKLLGKGFYKKKKHPIPVKWGGQSITVALNSTFMYVSGGTCSVVKVARVSQPREEIIENVTAVLEGVAQRIPGNWENIQSYYLKTLESVSLPLYQSLPDSMPFKIELEGKKSLEPPKKRVKLAEGNKEKMDRLLKNVVEHTVVAAKPKNRKRKLVEGKQKALRPAG